MENSIRNITPEAASLVVGQIQAILNEKLGPLLVRADQLQSPKLKKDNDKIGRN